MKMKVLHQNALLLGMMTLLLSAPVLAYDKNDEQVIQQDIAKMHDAMKKQNGQVFVDMMPEPILKQMAKSLGMNLADTKALLAGMASGMSGTDVQFRANLAKIKVYQSKTKRDYVFIPTTTTMDGVAVEGKMFGVKDNGKWSYITWQDRYKKWVKIAYPDIQKLP
ncbi:hypothetical protein SAMN02746062_02257 [Alysiella filiformis DSM 16848]|uniref:DUF4440 domain-containing protein n=2 Tax=Alysiella TaxID=194195 RepID=A0A286ERN8_9NEIS|nr:hypothetical protein [Alysiella filiformis]SOD73469.1 hypothetical protein SAMN02746062_02257 [Alysiella filiformis DSM 16848]